MPFISDCGAKTRVFGRTGPFGGHPLTQTPNVIPSLNYTGGNLPTPVGGESFILTEPGNPPETKFNRGFCIFGRDTLSVLKPLWVGQKSFFRPYSRRFFGAYTFSEEQNPTLWGARICELCVFPKRFWVETTHFCPGVYNSSTPKTGENIRWVGTPFGRLPPFYIY